MVRCDGVFFYCDGDHRDLHVQTHTFPTRRSYDLTAGTKAALVLGLGALARWRFAARAALAVPFASMRVFALALREDAHRSEEHTSALQSLQRISYAVLCLKQNTKH